MAPSSAGRSAGREPWLRDRVALITGGSSGIGLATALRFVDAGVRGVAILARGRDRLKAAAAEIDAHVDGQVALPIACDTTQEGQVIAAFEKCEQAFGDLHVVVSNAGTATSGALDETSLDLWNEMMAVHATGYFLVARESVRTFKRLGHGGSLVFVVSDNGIKPGKRFLAYNAGKAAELHMARCIAEEVGPLGIRVNSVLPGAVFGRSAFWTPELRAQRAANYGFDPSLLEAEYKKNAALRATILPEEVAEVIAFLASDLACKTTGAAFSIDGGGATGYVR
jgi:NAD(P)-dependent dehydrogenase (short-subunit alcohol dehydrogenase family)